MANRKIEKALYGPSTTEVVLGAILGLIAGVLVACVYLVFKPVQQVKEVPKESVRGVLYYIPGAELSGRARTWTEKQTQLLAGRSVTVNEDELNAWSKATFDPQAKTGDQPSNAPQGYDGIFNPQVPNFKITDGNLQIGTKCVLNWYGVTSEVTIVTTGTLQPKGDDFVFEPREFYLGSCPVHLIPGLMQPLASHLIGKKKVPDEIKSAWAKASAATLEGNMLKLTMP